MGGDMSKYTEAQFAATLIECGPHMPACDARHCSNPHNCPNNQEYHDRVRRYYVEAGLFATLVPGYGWTVFWREYRAWVET